MARSRSWRRPLAVIMCAALTLGVVTSAGADPAPDDYDSQKQAQQAIIDAAAARSSQIDAALDTTNSALAAAVAELADLDAKVTAAQGALVAAQAKVDAVAAELGLLQGRLAAAQAESTRVSGEVAAASAAAEKVKIHLIQLAQAAYKGAPVDAHMVLLLSAASLEDFVAGSQLQQVVIRTQEQAKQALEQLGAVNRARQDRLNAIQATITELTEQVEAKLAEANTARQAAAAAKAELDQAQAAQKARIDSLGKYKADLENEYAVQDAARKDALAAIAKINAAEQAAKKSPGTPGGSGAFGFTNPTRFKPPVITSSYGMRFHPVLNYSRMHWGTDLRSYCGDPVYAAQSGTVQWANTQPGYGNQVMINHGRINGSLVQSSYSHLSRLVVGSGQQVSRGQLIGYAGNTGISAACHLHWEVFVNGSYVNPMSTVNW